MKFVRAPRILQHSRQRGAQTCTACEPRPLYMVNAI